MSRRVKWAAATVALSLLLMLILAGLESGGIVHPESTAFLRVYNDSSRPVWEIVYDPLVTDWNAYQARELSYLVDWVDARIIYACARMGMAHFYSFSAFVILLLCVVVQQYFMARDFTRIPPVLCSLFSLAFLMAPSCRIFVFFRSAKPLTALAVTVICFAAWHLFLRRDNPRDDAGTWLLLGAGVLLAPAADRQGAFVTATFAGMCGAALTASAFEPVRSFFGISVPALRKLRKAGIIGGSGVLLGAVYNLWLAPALIRAFNGYEPSFAYQNIGGGGVFNFRDGGLFFLDNCGFFLLHIYGMAAFVTGMLLLLLWSWHWLRTAWRAPRLMPGALLFAAMASAMMICSNLMTFRHQLMLRDDVLHGSYFMPMLAALLFLAAVTLEITEPIQFLSGAATALLLCSILTTALGPHLSRPGVQDHLIFYRLTAPLVIRAMNDPTFDADRALLPYSSLKLVNHFHNAGASPRSNSR